MTEKKKRTFADAMVAVLLMIPIFALRGWALSLVWAWYVHPAFPSLPLLSFRAATGLVIAKSVVSANAGDSGDKPVLEIAFEYAFVILFVLGVAWIGHLILGTP